MANLGLSTGLACLLWTLAVNPLGGAHNSITGKDADAQSSASSFLENTGRLSENFHFFIPQGRHTIALRRRGVDQLPANRFAEPAVRMNLINGSSGTGVAGAESVVNRFSAESSGTRVSGFAAVTNRGVYPGIGFTHKSTGESGIGYSFNFVPRADQTPVRLRFQGARAARVDTSGALELALNDGELGVPPSVVEEGGKSPRSLKTAYHVYHVLTTGSVRHEVSPSNWLAAAPAFGFMTYLGGSQYEAAYAVSTDVNGFVYVAGETYSSNFPGAQNAPSGGKDIFVTKMSADGKTILFSTIIGGSGDDSARAIAIDNGGNVYVTGVTTSTNFPTTTGALQTVAKQQGDAFAVKLNATGGLVYSTLIGGDGSDTGTGIAVDASGNAYIGGYTSSVNFPVTAGAFQTLFRGGYYDGFICKINPTGSALVFSTFLGGTSSDTIAGLALDASGNTYVTGETDSFNFPTFNAYQPANGGGIDAFVTKLNAAGSALVFSTYFGGFSADLASTIALDSTQNVYIGGSTYSLALPVTATAAQAQPGGNYDGFVVKFNSAGTQILYCSYLGGNDLDEVSAIAVDSFQNIWIVGTSMSFNFPAKAALQPALHGGRDSFLAVIDSTGGSLLYSSYLGGAGDDQAFGIALDGSGNAFTAGYTSSADFPATAGFQSSYGGNYDGWVGKTHVSVSAARPNKMGTFRNGSWLLDYAGNGQVSGAGHLILGQAGDVPVSGDWNGSGKTKIGVFRNGLWLLADDTGALASNGSVFLGHTGDIPVVGDWTGSGHTKIGVFSNGVWLLTGNNGSLARTVTLGQAGDVPVVGDWNGDGISKIGVFRNGIWFLADDNGVLSARGIIGFGQAGDTPITGDWTGNGKTKIGIFRDGYWFLADDNGNLSARSIIGFGQKGDTPISADWNGDGRSKLGVIRNGLWFLDINGDTGLSGNEIFSFGQLGDTPVVGRW